MGKGRTRKSENKLNILIMEEVDLTPKQRQDISQLQALCFSDIDPHEIEEDFYTPKIANALVYTSDQLVGWAGIHQATVNFEGKKINLGGFSICTHPDWRRQGIATKASQKTMDFLRGRGCDIAFLSVVPSKEGPERLHQKTGFVHLPRKFSWTNRSGEVKQDNGGMIAPLCSQALFEQVLKGTEPLYVGQGYW